MAEKEFPMRMATLFLALLTVVATGALAQTTAFTYQGDLREAGQAVSGTFDMRFRLFTAASGGAQIGSTICSNNVTVSDGTFTTIIDFGPQFVSTSARFLEVIVRPDTGQACSTDAGYVTISPRQQITSTPRALAASIANGLSAPDGSPENALVVDVDGRIGFGTSSPTHSVHIANPSPTLALQDTDSFALHVGYISYRDNGNVERAWMGYGSPGDPDISVINARPNGDIVLNPLGSGRVGVGTGSPLATLDVRGDVRMGSSGQYLAATGEESVDIVRGTVEDLNSGHCALPSVPIHAGSGFSVEGVPGTLGEYLITFDHPFASPPAVVGSSYWDSFFGGKRVIVNGVTNSTARLRVFESNGDVICRQFSFIAIGVR